MPILRLEFIRGTLSGKTIEVTNHGVYFGRDPDCEIRLDEALISRRHARIRGADGGYLIEDLGSTNGLRVNGIRLKGNIELGEGDHVRIGESEFICRLPTLLPVGERTTEGKKPDIGKTRIPDERELTSGMTTVSGIPGSGSRVLLPALIVVLILAITAWLVVPALLESGSAGGKNEAQRPPAGEGDASDTLAAVPIPGDDDDDDDSDSPGLPEWPAIGPIPSVAKGDPAGGSGATSDTSAATGPIADQPPAKDADFIWVDSKPSKAVVYLNGEIVGHTPLFMDALKPAMYHLRFELDGYETANRSFEVPSYGHRETVSLRQLPDTCLVTSSPEGAAIIHGSRLLGYTPAIIPRSGAGGAMPVRIILPMHAPVELELAFDPGRPTQATANLKSQLGSLTLSIIPAGASVFLDGFDKGQAEPVAAGVADAEPMQFDGLSAGEHELYVRYHGITSPVETITVPANAAIESAIILWLPDTELTLSDGRKLVGLVLSETPTAITFLAAPDKRMTISVDTITAQRTLPKADIIAHHEAWKNERRRAEMQRKLEELRKNDDGQF